MLRSSRCVANVATKWLRIKVQLADRASIDCGYSRTNRTLRSRARANSTDFPSHGMGQSRVHVDVLEVHGPPPCPPWGIGGKVLYVLIPSCVTSCNWTTPSRSMTKDAPGSTYRAILPSSAFQPNRVVCFTGSSSDRSPLFSIFRGSEGEINLISLSLSLFHSLGVSPLSLLVRRGRKKEGRRRRRGRRNEKEERE